ncbi:MAG: TonB-dependent receptor [Pseudomonadota bacterium]
MKTVHRIGRGLVPLALAVAAAQVSAQDELLEEIVVYAEKLGRSVQDTATSTVVVTPETIEDLNIVTLGDALQRIGNAGFTTTGRGRVKQFTLRGVQSGGVTPGTTPVATLIVDGAFVPNQAAGSTISNAWDVRQIEVLRGAQSTLQGRNSLIGAIQVTTEEAGWENDFRLRGTYGEYDTWEGSVAFGGPIVDEQVAYRIVAQQLESDGFVERADGDDGDALSSTLLRAKLRIEPDAIPDLRWDIVASYTDEETGNSLVSGEDPFEREQITDIKDELNAEVFTLANTLTYQLNSNIELVSLTSYALLETDEVLDFDGLPDQGTPVSSVRFDEREFDDLLQEFRLLYTDDGLTALGGLLLATRENFGETTVEQMVGALPIGSDFVFEPEFDTVALFGEAAWDLSERITLTGGLRYEREKATYGVSQVNYVLIEGEPVLSETDSEVEQTFEVWLPKFVLTYNFNDDVSLSGSVQRAYRPGGIGVNPVQGNTFDFDPEYSWNYEIALRSVWLDNRLVVNANAFFIDWTDQQIEVQLSGTPQDEATQNVGESELYGVEVQATWSVTDELTLFGSLGLLETEITDTDASNSELIGNEFPFAPNYSGAAGITYAHPSGFSGTLDLAFRGDSEPVLPNNSGSNPEFGTGLKNDDVVLTNLRLTYAWDRFSVFAYGRNLLDEEYLVNADALVGNVIVGEPRVVGAGFTFTM